jgi:hypothetical protein
MNESDNAWKTLGVYIQPGIGTAYPELNKLLQAFFKSKVATIPWLPAGWLDSQAGLQAAYPGDQIRIAPAFKGDGSVSPLAPVWLDTPEKRQLWQELFKRSNEIVTAYAAGEAAKGKVLLDKLYSEAAFWDRMYNIAVTVRDLPKTVVGAAGDFASGVVGEFLKKFWIVIAVGGIGFILYVNRNSLAKAAGKRLGA